MRPAVPTSPRRLRPLSVSLARLGSLLGIAAAMGVARTEGAEGFDAYYYNFPNNPGTGSTLFASHLLQGFPYVSTQIDQTINVPQPGPNGTFPIEPVPGFGTAAAGGINDGGMWKGLLNITAAGDYQFSGTNDDSAVLYIDGVQIGTLDVKPGLTNIGGLVNLSAGQHTIVYKFTQGGGGGYTTLRYNGGDTGNVTQLVGSIAGTVTNGSLAPTDLGPITVSANTTLNLAVDSSAPSLTFTAPATLTVTSPTISSLTVTGATTLGGGTTTLNNSTAAVTFDGSIGETAASGLTISGGYLTRFNAANAYTGLTTVTAGELDLNATGGNAIAGNLTINAANTNGVINNVKLLQSNQIADSSTVTVARGVLNIGGFDDTVGTLVLTGGTVKGTGTLTATNVDLQTGTIEVNLAGGSGVTKNTPSNLILSGTKSYTGATVVSDGKLIARGTNALGAGGVGNGTTVSTGGILQLVGVNAATEDVTVNGSGSPTAIGGATEGAIRVAGDTTIASLTTGSASTISVDAGQLIINGALNVGGGPLTKVGAGTLTFASNQSSIPAVNLVAGALGFSGPQSFGAATVPAGLAYRFNTDPTAGVNITAPTGTSVIAGYAADQSLVSRINAASAGTLALAVDSANNLNFSSVPNLSLGAMGIRSYGGVLTPGAGGYRLGGGGGELMLTQPLSSNSSVTISGPGTVSLFGPQTFAGATTVDGAGARLRVLNHHELGANGNALNLTNGGTLELIGTYGTTGAAGGVFHQLGNQATGSARSINIGAGGGRIMLTNFANGGTVYALTAADSLTGSGALTKEGYGNLMVMSNNSFAGSLTIADLGNTVELRNNGALANVTSIDIGQSANFIVDNQNGFGSRQYAGLNNANRLSNTAPITIRGGQLLYRGRNVAGETSETFGAVSLPTGNSIIRVEINGQGADVTLGGLARSVGGGTVRFDNNGGTFGGTANNPRLIISGATATNNIGGWAFINNNGGNFQFAAYDAAAGIKPATTTNQGAAAWTPTSGVIYELNAGGTATLNDSAGNALDLDGFRFGNNAAQTLAFADGADTLFIGSGSILEANNNQARTIGSAAARGNLTAGTSTAAAGAKELFFHINQNTTTIESNIVDNNGPVTLVKDMGGTIQLNSGGSTYSGGTNIWSGRVNVVAAGGLGSGNVVVRGAALELRAAGTVTGNSTITGKNQSEIYLQANANYNGPGDRFIIESGSTITSAGNAAGVGLASLTRVSSITAPGQIVLEPGTTVRATSLADGDIMQNMIANLGTAADLYFNTSATGGQNQFITIGAGTAWKGLSSGAPGAGWLNGTIYANSDFWLEGQSRNGGNVVLSLGTAQATNQPGSYSIVNTAGKAINAYVSGQVALNEDTPVSMPGDLTFVVTPGGYLQPNFTNSFGFGGTTAKVIVQAGGTVDPGNFTTVGTGANQPQGFAYPLPSPLNTQATFEAGGRFLINDVSGIGNTAAGNWTMKANSILQLGNTQVFLGGNANGLINAGQFAFEPGAIVRVGVDRIFRFNDFLTDATAAQGLVYELFDNNRGITDAVNPMIVAAVGTPTIEVMNLAFGDGDIITNDSTDRQFNERRGHVTLDNGAILAATTQTFLNIQEDVRIPAGATVTIGSTKTIDGLTKAGTVQLTGPNSNGAAMAGNIVIANGGQLSFGAVNVWPDAKPLDLATAVTTFSVPGALPYIPGDGSSLLLNVANFMEHVGPLTGNGAVIANQGGTAIATGRGAVSDFTSNVVFKSTNGQNPSLVKTGSTRMTLTGTSDSTGDIVAQEGELVVAGTGKVDFNQARAQEGAKLIIDNSGAAMNNRLGNPAFWIPSGGTFELIGNATTPVTEAVGSLASGTGNFINVAQNGQLTAVNITPGAATTTLAIGALEHFQNSGQRTSSWVIRTPAMGNQPGTVAIDGIYTPDPDNTLNGVATVATPNFISNLAFGAGPGGTIVNAPGTPVVPTRPDILWDTNANGDGQGFVTADGVLRFGAIISGQNTMTVNNSDRFTVGQTITGGNIPAGTTVTEINGNVLTLSATATGTAGTINSQLYNFADPSVNYLRPLADSEYAGYLRDNQSVNLNVKLSGTTNTSGDTRIQTLTLTPGSILNINGNLPLNSSASRVHLNGAGVFVQAGGTASITGTANTFLQANGGAGLYLHTRGNLDVSTTLFSDVGVIKTGSGTLNLAAGAVGTFRGSFQVDGGTVNLAPGNTFANVRAQTGFTGPNLYINGGTLNLNGNSQMVNLLNSSNELPGMGGTVTSAADATLTVLSGGRFSGQLTGDLALVKAGNNTLLLTNDNPFTGTTTLRGGTLVLRDSARLSGTTAVDINYATLQFDNGYLSNVANRLGTTVPVSMRGGTINLTGAAGQVATQSFGTVSLLEGSNNFTSNAGGGGANEVTIANLVRTASNGTVVNFQQNYGFVGTAGNDTTAIRNFIGSINGSAIALNDGIIGAWAVVNGDNYATYSPTTGIGAYGNTDDGFAAYESVNVLTATATQNVNDGAARTFIASTTVNSWRIAPNVGVTMTFNAGAGLTLDSGGLLINNSNPNTTSLNAATGASGNFITSNTGELIAFVNQSTASINIPITGGINLVKSGGGGLNLRPESSYSGTVTNGSASVPMTSTAGLVVGQPVSGTGIQANTFITEVTPTGITLSKTANGGANAVTIGFGNSFTGTTIVNGGTLTLNMGGADANNFVAVPGDVLIQNATLTEANVGGQIKASANVTIGGGGRLNLVAAAGVTETLRSLTFLDGAGANGTANGLDRTATQPTSTINLTAPIAITATNTNPSTGVPFIGGNTGIVGFTNPTGATLDINSPVDVRGVSAVGLRIDGTIATVPTGVANGGLIKSGTGLLVLNPTAVTAGAATLSSSTTNASNVVTLASTSGLLIGQPISGTNIPAGAFVTNIVNGTTVTISANATGTATNNLTYGGVGVNQFGNPTGFDGSLGSLVDVFNVQSGYVRVDQAGALGGNTANTVVQSGAVLLSSNTGGTFVTGSIRLNSGSTLAATINSFFHGRPTTDVTSQSVLNVPSGAVNIAAYDYFVPGTNNGNITVTGRLTGAGTLNLVGPKITQGAGGGGVIQLANPIVSGLGANDFSGLIVVGTNAILSGQQYLLGSATSITGNQLGTATVELNGGRLRLRDDFSTTNSNQSSQVVEYGNNIVVSADSFLDANRTVGTGTNNTIGLGSLTVPTGVKTLTVDSTNNYQVSFDALAGAGTLIKGGNGLMTIESYAPTFTGGFGFAGPQGNTVVAAFNTVASPNVTFAPTANTFQDFTVNGFFITPADKTFNVPGEFSVRPNPGNVTGALGVTTSTSITSGIFRNDGQVGPVSGPATITATSGFQGSGHYVAHTQQLSLSGNVIGGTLRTAGDSRVTLTGTAQAFTGGVEVQSGTLQLLPSSSSASVGAIRVIGSPVSTAGPTAAAIDAVQGTLELDAITGSINHTGTITNSGLVRVANGVSTVAGDIKGPGVGYLPGLLEGYTTAPGGSLNVSAGRVPNPGNFGIRMEPRMLQTNAVTQQAVTGHTDNDTWIYTGYVKDDDGVFSFAENIDDRAAVWIDGTLVLNATNGGTSRVVSTAYSYGQQGTVAMPNANLGTPSQSFGPGVELPSFGSGWHLIEIRMNNGTGGSGPIAGNGFGVNYGFGYKNGIAALDGADMIKPIDDGTGNLFVTPINAKGIVQLDAGGILNANSIQSTASVVFNATDAKLNITGTTTASNSDKIEMLTTATMNLGANSNFTTEVVSLGTNVLILNNTSDTVNGTMPTGTLHVTGTGTGTGVVDLGGGGLNVTGSISGAVNVGDGVLSGNSTSSTTGTIEGLVDLAGGVIAPNNANPGMMLLKGGVTFTGGSYAVDLAGVVPGAGYDQLNVTGTVILNSNVPLSVNLAFQPAIGDIFTLVLNDTGGDDIFGLGLFSVNGNPLADGDTFIVNTIHEFEISYDGGDGNDVTLTYLVPEPGSAALLLGGLATLCGRRRRSSNLRGA